MSAGDRVRHVGSYHGPIAVVQAVEPALDPAQDQVTIAYEWQGKPRIRTLSAWRLVGIRA